MAVARFTRKPEACVVTAANWSTLVECASDRWVEHGVHHFACAERGDEWVVTMEARP
jgi:hypothetical protein